MDTEVVTEQASVLVVDDNPLMVNVLKGLLGQEHYQVFTARNGEEALSVLGSKRVDVIVCDVMMPQMDGYELHQNIRNTPKFSHIPFVFLSALSDSSQVRRGKEAGADDYLAKPFDPQELVAVIRGKVLRSKNLQQGSEQCYDSYRKKVIHTLSHEFRTPLVAINTGTDLLIERKGAIEENKVRHLLEAIQRGGRRLEQLVNDFMSLQQIEAGIAKRVHDAHASIHKVPDLLNTFREAHNDWLSREGFVLTITDQSNEARVRVYAPQVLDILARFAHNTVKFKLKILTIDIVAYRQLNEVYIEVRDRGIGMDPDRVREAVDVFGQIDRDKLEQQGGGLGLAIANRYAVLNGGRLEFESRKDGGAVVTLVLPLAECSQ